MWILTGILGCVFGSAITALLLRHRASRPASSRDSLRQTVMRGIAHEIRNPLNTMSITLQLLEEDLTGESAPTQGAVLADVGRVRREVDRLERILSDFQRYARMQFRPDDVDIGALVNETLDFMEAEAARAGVEITRSVPRGITAGADSALLRQAFLNVIVNAFQAIGEDGRLSVAVEAVGSDIVVSFADTGPGMDEVARRRAFEPYYSTKEDGTGLGLSIAYNLVKNNGGKLSLGAPLTGAEFVLCPPLARSVP